MSVLAWVIQEAKAPPSEGAGTRVGLSESGLFALLKKLVTLKMDTLSLVASMQIQRVRNALGTQQLGPKKEEGKSIPILSAEAMEEDEKKEEKRAQKSARRRRMNVGFSYTQRGESKRGGFSHRRHRQPPRPSRPSFQNHTQGSGFNIFNRAQSSQPRPAFRTAQRPGQGPQRSQRPFQSSSHRGTGAARGGRFSSRGRPRQY